MNEVHWTQCGLALDWSSHCSLRTTAGSLCAKVWRGRTMTVPNGLLSTLRLEPMLETTLRELSAARSELAYTCESRGAVRAHVHHGQGEDTYNG